MAEETKVEETKTTSKQWVYFGLYCLVALLAKWYTTLKGKDSEVLVKLKAGFKERLNSKQLKLYEALKKVYNKFFGTQQA